MKLRTARVTAALVAMVLALPLAPSRISATSVTHIAFTRIAGSDRFATAALLATSAFPAGAPTVILATGFNFPDALAANYLAGQLGAPILLVNGQLPVPPATLSALRALHTTKVILLGLEAAIGRDVQAALAATPSSAAAATNLSVARIGGQDRYDTMNLVDETPGPSSVGVVGNAKTAIVASGATFPDSLASGPLAYPRSLPLVLTDPNTLSPGAAQTLQDLGVRQVLIAGGPLAVSPGVEAAIHSLGVSTLARFAGIDRTDTARLIGDYAIAHLGFTGTHFDVASGDSSLGGADALALGALAARSGTRPIQLVQSVAHSGIGAPQFIRDNLNTLTPDNLDVIAGGPSAVPDVTVEPLIVAYDTGTGVTALPELVAAQIVTSTTGDGSATTPQGTIVRFIFDEGLVGPPGFDHFRVYDSTNPDVPFLGVSGPGSELDPLNPDAVLVDFPTLAAPGSVGNLSVATVELGAVADLQGTSNPDGAAPLGSPHALPPAGGTTQAPDPESVGNARQAGSATTALDLAFDQPAFGQLAATADVFTVVYADQPMTQAEAVCQAPFAGDTAPSGGTTPGGNGTSTWTIVCPDDPARAHAALTPRTVARVVVRAGAVGTAPSGAAGDVVAGSIQATDSPRATAVTPSLSDASLVPATSFGGADGILGSFDQPVNDQSVAPPATPPQAARFFAVLADGTSLPANAVFRSASDPTRVLAMFGPGVDTRAVGLAIQAGAVSGQASGGANADDEVAVSNSEQITITPGSTEGPGLISAALTPFANSGVIVGESALLVFGQALAGPPQPFLGGIHGYDADGTQLTCKPPAVGGGANGLDAADNPFPDAGAPTTLQCDSWAVGPLSDGPTASLTQQQTIVLLTVDAGTVANVESQYNPDQAEIATGGTGVPVQG